MYVTCMFVSVACMPYVCSIMCNVEWLTMFPLYLCIKLVSYYKYDTHPCYHGMLMATGNGELIMLIKKVRLGYRK